MGRSGKKGKRGGKRRRKSRRPFFKLSRPAARSNDFVSLPHLSPFEGKGEKGGVDKQRKKGGGRNVLGGPTVNYVVVSIKFMRVAIKISSLNSLDEEKEQRKRKIKKKEKRGGGKTGREGSINSWTGVISLTFFFEVKNRPWRREGRGKKKKGRLEPPQLFARHQNSPRSLELSVPEWVTRFSKWGGKGEPQGKRVRKTRYHRSRLILATRKWWKGKEIERKGNEKCGKASRRFTSKTNVSDIPPFRKGKEEKLKEGKERGGRRGIGFEARAR